MQLGTTTTRVSPVRVGVRNILGGTSAAGIYVGDTDPSSVPTGATAGVAYLNQTSGDVFQLGSNMQWSKVGNVQGPAGPPGAGGSVTQATIDAIQAATASAVLEQVDARIAALPPAGVDLSTGTTYVDSEGIPFFEVPSVSGTTVVGLEGLTFIEIEA